MPGGDDAGRRLRACWAGLCAHFGLWPARQRRRGLLAPQGSLCKVNLRRCAWGVGSRFVFLGSGKTRVATLQKDTSAAWHINLHALQDCCATQLAHPWTSGPRPLHTHAHHTLRQLCAGGLRGPRSGSASGLLRLPLLARPTPRPTPRPARRYCACASCRAPPGTAGGLAPAQVGA